MPGKLRIAKLLQNDWILAALLFLIFFLTNGYIYAWDDQHLEIPLLKSLIDPNLYPDDYYVQSLKANFPSLFYIILSRLITLEQVPAAYLILYILSRFFLFFWMYKLLCFISQKKSSAFLCTAVIILLGRVEEFLYRTFSHQEFALAIIMAGIYFFYRERFILAAILLGIAANFHALYSLFPMIYLNVFLLIFQKEQKWRTIAKSSLFFIFAAAPAIFLIIKKYLISPPAVSPPLKEWLDLYLLTCSQNFIFQDIPLEQVIGGLKAFFLASRKFLFLILLYAVNLTFYRPFEKDHKIYAISISAVTMLAVSFIFTYIFPNRFVIDLNLIRNIQYLLFFYTGYATLLFIEKVQSGTMRLGFLLGILFMFLRLPSLDHYTLTYGYLAAIITALLAINFLWSVLDKRPRFIFLQKYLFLIIPLLVTFSAYSFFHVRYLGIVKHGSGFWQIQRNWIDMQNYAKNHTPKNALFLVPHDTEMGGFRIFSERAIVVCYRDCGIIGFDYAAAVEWKKRLNDIEGFCVLIKDSQALQQAVINAIFRYKVNYIVFMRYSESRENLPLLEKLYENEVFSLYKVKTNPVKGANI